MWLKKNIPCHMVDQCPLLHPIPKSITESEEVELQADRQHSPSAAGQVHSGRLIGDGTQWLEEKMLCLGASLWRASHSTSCPQTRSDLSSWGWDRNLCTCSTPSGGTGRRWCAQPVSCGETEAVRHSSGCDNSMGQHYGLVCILK